MSQPMNKHVVMCRYHSNDGDVGGVDNNDGGACDGL
jgi:hypothetical protein